MPSEEEDFYDTVIYKINGISINQSLTNKGELIFSVDSPKLARCLAQKAYQYLKDTLTEMIAICNRDLAMETNEALMVDIEADKQRLTAQLDAINKTAQQQNFYVDKKVKSKTKSKQKIKNKKSECNERKTNPRKTARKIK